jgi:hypothetical protein
MVVRTWLLLRRLLLLVLLRRWLLVRRRRLFIWILWASRRCLWGDAKRLGKRAWGLLRRWLRVLVALRDWSSALGNGGGVEVAGCEFLGCEALWPGVGHSAWYLGVRVIGLRGFGSVLLLWRALVTGWRYHEEGWVVASLGML